MCNVSRFGLPESSRVVVPASLDVPTPWGCPKWDGAKPIHTHLTVEETERGGSKRTGNLQIRATDSPGINTPTPRRSRQTRQRRQPHTRIPTLAPLHRARTRTTAQMQSDNIRFIYPLA